MIEERVSNEEGGHHLDMNDERIADIREEERREDRRRKNMERRNKEDGVGEMRSNEEGNEGEEMRN